jgi:CMP-N-acetylneuraminic acid synthetase
MKIATIILARKGSRRIKNKSITKLGGHPLLEWTVRDAVRIGYESWLFTDIEEAPEICKNYNITIRPKKYENKNGIHKTAKELLFYNKEISADIIILLQPTSPFRIIESIRIWIESFLESDFQAGFAGYWLRGGYYYDRHANPLNYDIKARTYNGGKYKYIFKETGSFYIFHRDQLFKNHILNGRCQLYPDPFDIDIDTIEDLKQAEDYLNENKTDFRNWV